MAADMKGFDLLIDPVLVEKVVKAWRIVDFKVQIFLLNAPAAGKCFRQRLEAP